MTALVCVLAVGVALLGLLVAGLLRSHAEILRRLHVLDGGDTPDRPPGRVELEFPGVRPGVTPPREVGTPAFDLAGVTPDDEAVVVGVVGAAQPTLVAFLSSGCHTCAGFWQAFRRPDRLGLPEGTRLVVVTRAPAEESVSRVRDLAPAGVTTVMSGTAWTDYQVPVSPYFLYVDGPTGAVLGEGAAGSWDQVAGLLRQALDDRDTVGGRPRRASERRPADRGDATTRRVPDATTLRGSDATTRRGSDGAAREARADSELRAAGIVPGDPSLYPSAPEPATPSLRRQAE